MELTYLGDGEPWTEKVTIPRGSRAYYHFPKGEHGTAPTPLLLAVLDVENVIEPQEEKREPLAFGAPAALNGILTAPGEVDRYLFSVIAPSNLVIETTGPSDTVLYIAGPGNPQRLYSSNDDGGDRFNARIQTQFTPGVYYAYIVFYDRSQTGNYAISVSS